jgi:hypothetical protein
MGEPNCRGDAIAMLSTWARAAGVLTAAQSEQFLVWKGGRVE